jgi:Bacterial Ig domain
MFNVNRARQGAANPILRGTSARAGLLLALAGCTFLGWTLVGAASPTSQTSNPTRAMPPPTSTTGSSEQLVQTTQPTRTSSTASQPTRTTLAGRTPGRPPVIPARAEVRLELDPDPAKILLGGSQDYTATLVIRVGPYQPTADNHPDAYVYRYDVTGWTSFVVRGDRACDGATCTPTKIGGQTVVGSFPRWPGWPKQIHGNAVLQVEPVVAGLTLEPKSARILLGESQQYKVEAIADGGPVDLDELSAKPVLEIDQGGCTGTTCTPTAAGTRTVRVTLTQPGRRPVTATASLHVEPVVTSLRLRPDQATILEGESRRYDVEAFAADGSRVDLALVAARPVLTVHQDRECTGTTCTPTKAGTHTVRVTLTQNGRTPVTATAVLRVERVVERLRLEPDPKTIELGQSQDYTVEAFATDGSPVGLDELSAKPILEIDQDGACRQATCTPTRVGKHTVKATLTQQGRAPVTAFAVLQVEEPPPKPSTASIASVTPGLTPANRPVEVRGNTGSCGRAGTLSLHATPAEVSVQVTGDARGDFVARFTVPEGTFPNTHALELTVDCNGQVQRADGELTVVNVTPVAADDSAVTTQDTPVAIAVTANDRNPDPDTGYQTIVVEHGPPPPNGTIRARSDGIITYTPRTGFLGRDRFQYGLCDNVVNAAGTADCATATVTVTVDPRGGAPGAGAAGGGAAGSGAAGGGPPAAAPPGGGIPAGGPSGGGPPTTTGRCAPSAGDLRERLRVEPGNGPGGTKLRITAKVDQNLAACPLRLLLGGAPLGADVSVGPDGSILAQLPVPTGAIPGNRALSLATTDGQVLDETSFEVLPTLLRRWWQRDPFRLLLGGGALLAGALTRAAIRRLRRLVREREQRKLDPARQHGLRAEPYAHPPEVTVEPGIGEERTFTVRLQPHGDAGTLTLQEVNR